MTLKELAELRKRYPTLKLEKLELEEEKEELENKTTTDVVRGSSTEFPYLNVPVSVEGHTLSRSDKVKLNAIKKRIENIIDILTQIDKLIDSIDDNVVRYAVKHYVKKSETWTEIYEHIDNYSNKVTVSALRMRVKRVVEKL